MASNAKKKDEILRRILYLIDSLNLSDQEVEEYLDIGKGMMSHWRYGGRTTYLRYINQFCELLDTTPDYLFLGTEIVGSDNDFSAYEKKLIKIFRNMDDEWKKHIDNEFKLIAKCGSVSEKEQ